MGPDMGLVMMVVSRIGDDVVLRWRMTGPNCRAGSKASVQGNRVIVLARLVGLRQIRVTVADAPGLVEQRLRLIVGQGGDNI